VKGDVQILATEIERRQFGNEVDGNLGIHLEERRKPWHQPARAERGQHRKIQDTGLRLGNRSQGCVANRLQRSVDLCRVDLPSVRQLQRFVVAPEQLDTELVFQCAYLSTDGTLRYFEFVSRRGEVSGTCGGVKGDQHADTGQESSLVLHGPRSSRLGTQIYYKNS
jgi:hypothetical protein